MRSTLARAYAYEALQFHSAPNILQRRRLSTERMTSPAHNAFLASAVASTSEAIVGKDMSGTIVTWNPAAEALLGWTAAEIIGKSITEILPPERASEQEVIHERTKQGERIRGYETSRKHKDGSLIDVSITVSPVTDGNGVVIGSCTILQDVSQRDQPESALREANEFLHALFESAPDAIVVVDKRGSLVRVNGLAERMFRYEHGELLGKPIELLVPDRFRDIHVHHRDAYIANARTRPMGTGSLVGKRKDGTEFAVDIMLSPISVGVSRLVMAIVRDVSDRKRAETALHEANEFLRGLFESAPDAIIVVDDRGELQRINHQAEKLFGYSGDELLGQKLEILIPERFRQRHVSERDMYIHEPRTRPMGAGLDLQGRRKDGSEFPVDIMLSPLELPSGSRRIMAVVRDITERRAIEEDLRRARDEAIEANRLKSQFVANISHEVRTPMSGIIGMAEILLYEGNLSDQQKEAADHIYTSSKRLLTVLDDLLDFSKLEVGAIQLDNVDFSPRKVVDEVLASVQIPGQKKGLEIQTFLDPELPNLVHGDEAKIRQTLLNLAHNAVKFTHEGTIILSVHRENTSNDVTSLRFSVQDTGIGITDGARERLFEPFMQADGTHRRRYGGTGLGLSIAKRFVELMGGTIGVITTPEQGSTFWFSVPLELR
jgi:PAS domain S-box-containing protein